MRVCVEKDSKKKKKKKGIKESMRQKIFVHSLFLSKLCDKQ